MAIAKTNKHPSEHIEQVRVVTWFDRCQPTLRGRLMAIPNGGQRNLVVATKLKAEGVTAGVPDLFVPGRRAFIEVKKPGGRISPAQRDMMVKLRLLGYDCIVAYSVEDVERFFALQGDKL